MSARSPRRRLASRVLALGVLGIVAAGPAALGYAALEGQAEAIRGETARLRAEAARLRARILAPAALAEREAALARHLAASGILVAARTPQLALGALQTAVGQAVRAGRGELVRIGFAPPEVAGPAIRLGLDLVYRAEPEAALRILERLETMRPLLLTRRVGIAPGGARGLIRADAPRTLDVELRLDAHMREIAE